MERKLNSDADNIVHNAYNSFVIEQKKLDRQRTDLLNACNTATEKAAVNQKIEEELHKATEHLKQELNAELDTFLQNAPSEVVRTVETQKQNEAKKTVEDSVKDHLRGFSRTIPSFLMAYGTEDVTLDTFDKVIPDKVFREVTSI